MQGWHQWGCVLRCACAATGCHHAGQRSHRGRRRLARQVISVAWECSCVGGASTACTAGGRCCVGVQLHWWASTACAAGDGCREGVQMRW
eukprot:145573-Chlamydomonas_euryale.AAC.18